MSLTLCYCYIWSFSGTSEGLEGDRPNPRKRPLIQLLESDSENKGEPSSDQERSWLSHEEIPLPPDDVVSFLNTTFNKCLSRPKRRLLSRLYPRADIPVLHPPTADKDITSVLGSEFPAQTDQRLSKIQSSVLSSSGPLIRLWSELSLQGFTGEPEELIPVQSVLEVCQQTLALVGNASCYINEVRRGIMIDRVKYKRPRLATFLQDICKEDLGEPTRELFGPTVKRHISERAQTIKSLRSLDPSPSSSQKRFLGKGSNARYGSTSSLPRPQPYTDRRRVFQPQTSKRRFSHPKHFPVKKEN